MIVTNVPAKLSYSAAVAKLQSAHSLTYNGLFMGFWVLNVQSPQNPDPQPTIHKIMHDFIRDLFNLPIIPHLGQSCVTGLTMAGLVMLSTWLGACTPSADGERQGDTDTRRQANHLSDDAHIQLINGQVVLDKNSLLSIKPERYQPSFELRGVILPHQEAVLGVPSDIFGDLSADADIKVAAVFVNEGQLVKADTALMRLQIERTPTADQRASQTDKDLVNQPTELVTQASNSSTTQDISNNRTNPDDLTDKNSKNSQNPSQTPPSQATDQSSSVTPTHVRALSSERLIKAPFSGTVATLHVRPTMLTKKDSPLVTIYDDSVFEFVSVLPARFEPYLKVGMTVSFVTGIDHKLDQSRLDDITEHQRQGFFGQVAKIETATPKIHPTASRQAREHIAVTVRILPEHHPHLTLTKGMQVSGRIDYGQIEVGAIVPRHAIISDALASLDDPPHKPAVPMPAKIWVIKQDGRLALTDVHIIAYQPNSQRYLVDGLTQDSLITTAVLPADVHGKEVKVR